MQPNSLLTLSFHSQPQGRGRDLPEARIGAHACMHENNNGISITYKTKTQEGLMRPYTSLGVYKQ